jgi:hypothetical protein
MTKMSVPSQQELMLARIVRESVLAEVASRHFDKEQLAHVLDLYPSGVGSLLRESNWSLEIAVRVADALGINVTESLKRSVA